MEGAGISFGLRNSYAVKYVYWARDGGADVKPANEGYPSLHFTEEDVRNDWFSIIGKVMKVMTNPRRGL